MRFEAAGAVAYLGLVVSAVASVAADVFGWAIPMLAMDLTTLVLARRPVERAVKAGDPLGRLACTLESDIGVFLMAMAGVAVLVLGYAPWSNRPTTAFWVAVAAGVAAGLAVTVQHGVVAAGAPTAAGEGPVSDA